VGEGDDELRALMRAYQGGSREAFQAIYATLAPELRRYLRHLVMGAEVADDLLQDTFLQMHRSRRAYNPAYAVRPWAFGLARNVFLMNQRATRRFIALHDARADLPEIAVPADVERLGSADEIRQCLAGLTSEQAEAFLLHHEWGFTFDEIAGMLGVTPVAARARASRGMADLRSALIGLRGLRA
jgi:RNA polymerase sigma-70 factor (ECF subfamily)